MTDHLLGGVCVVDPVLVLEGDWAVTLVGSCMLQGVDPQVYLADVLAKRPRLPSNRVGELLPGAWRRASEAHPGR